MSTETGGEVTRLLGELGRGQKEAMNQLLPLVYDELHRLARSYFRRERGEHTLQPTALVHEAYIRLVDQKSPMDSRGHFLAVAATQMRRILLDYARKHKAARRGGGGQQVLLEDTMAIVAQRASISKPTLIKVERGNPGVSIASYATVLFVMGMADRLADLVDPRNDPVGLHLEGENLPKRIRGPQRQKSVKGK